MVTERAVRAALEVTAAVREALGQATVPEAAAEVVAQDLVLAAAAAAAGPNAAGVAAVALGPLRKVAGLEVLMAQSEEVIIPQLLVAGLTQGAAVALAGVVWRAVSGVDLAVREVPAQATRAVPREAREELEWGR
jgi:hypothetical protein